LGTFGPYTKLKAVGKGSCGQIWLVRHTQKGGEQLVLKAVNLKKLSAGETASQRREIEVLKKMSHPHIIGFSLTFEEGDMVGLMMEYAAGGDLNTTIAKRVPPLCKEGTVRYHESEARRIAMQLAMALAYLHEQISLIHRDVKPANILLTADGDVKLGDFGACAYVSETRDASEPVGTPIYMAPEVAAAKGYGPSADVWAFGCTMFEVLSLSPPWSELDDGYGGITGGMQGLIKHVTTKSFDWAALKVANGGNYSEELVDSLAGLVVKDPAKRIQLTALVQKLEEKKAPPASWGLSAEAAAALAASS